MNAEPIAEDGVTRWPDHANQLGDWCPWSGKPVGHGEDVCPAMCPDSGEPAERPTVERVRVTWSRWSAERRRMVTSHPWQFIVTEPDGNQRSFDRRGAADAWISENYPDAS